MKLRKLILSLLAILPISSIAFAADFQLNNADEPKCPEEIEDEFLQRLEDQQLPLKYYRFYGIIRSNQQKTFVRRE